MRLKRIGFVAVTFTLVTLFIAQSQARAQSQADHAAVEHVPQAFAAAWAKHDGAELGKIMSDDVDFVDVAGDWLHGRSDFSLYSSRLLSGRFREAMLTPLATSVRFLRPDQAVVHWSWKLEGDRNFDGTGRKPRSGLFTMIVEKREGTWLVTVAQNTNRIPPPNPDPEMDGIKSATLFPANQ